MTTEEIMELVSIYGSEVADIASSESSFAHVGKHRYAFRDETLAELKAAIDSLVADASRYQWIAVYFTGTDDTYDDALVACESKEQLDAVIDAAMESK